MNESSKTLAFVISAAVMVGLAMTSYYVNLPKAQAEFELVGTDFFADFDSSEQAKSLEVVAIDGDDLTLQRFSVKNENGLWRIPSHHNYPAEAADRLAETATSVMGLQREALAGRMANEHPRLGVVDPLGDEIDDPESVGKRITLKDADNEVLVDYIIGKEAGEVSLSNSERELQASQDPEKYYYVRRADEQQTYKVKLDLDLSTKFSDWIDPDLLRLDRNNLVDIEIDNYSLEQDPRNPQALLKVVGDKLALTRSNNTEPWKLTELNEQTEELETSRINEITDVLTELKIAGVRPKFKYKGHLLLTQDLKLNELPEFEQDKRGFGLAIQQLQGELEDKGFSLAGSARNLELVSQNGQLQVGTNEGVRYFLQIGKEVEGEEAEIEIGNPGESKAADEAANEKTDAESGLADAEVDAKNRYLVVRVTFDDSLLGEKPVKPSEPVKPTQPVGYVPAPAEEKSGENADDQKQDAEKSETENEDQAPPPDDRDPAFIQYDAELKAYEDRRVNYEIELSRYEDELKEFEKKVEAGKQLVDELNLRFGDWYYVVTAENLKTLQTTRKDLVTEKEIPESERVPTRPDISFPSMNTEQADTEKADTEKADTEKADTEKADTEKADTEKADTEKADTEKADTEKADTEKAGSEKAGAEEAGAEKADTETTANDPVKTRELEN